MNRHELCPMEVVTSPQGKRRIPIVMRACFPENPDPKEQEELFRTLDKIIISEIMKDMDKNDPYYKEYEKIFNNFNTNI